MDETRLEIRRGTLDLLVLRALVLGPLHGYAIGRRIENRSEEAFCVEEDSRYPSLHRLERRGWLASELGHITSHSWLR